MTSAAKSQPHTRHRAAFAALVIALIVAALAFSSGGVSSQGPETQRRDLDRVFSRHDRLSLDPGQVQRRVKQTGSLTLATSRGTFELTLTPHDMRAPGYRAEATSDKGVRLLEPIPVRTYKGTVRGLPTAQARLTIDEETVEGLIITPGELFFLEPVKRYSGGAAKTDFVFYSESDLKEPLGECGTTMAHIVARQSENVSRQTSAKGPQPEEVFGPALDIDIATDADFEYFTAFGSAVNAIQQINDIMSQVEGIYNAQLGIQFNIVFQHVYEVAGDPYTRTNTGPQPNILSEFQDYWNTNRGSIQRDIVHLWTGKDIDGGTIGVAYQPGLECPFQTESFAYGLSQNIAGNRAGLTAHEIGHNLSAAHVNSDQGSDCGNPGGPTTSIMNPSISASTNFCQFSRDQITNHTIFERACLTPLTQPGCTYSLSQTTQNLAAGAGGNSVNITTQPGCNWAVAEGESWLTVTGGASGTGSGTVTYSVTANSICGQRTGLVSIGGPLLTVNQAGNPSYLTDASTATAIAPGQTLNGELSSGDCPYGLFGSSGANQTNAFMDRYKFNGMAGQRVRIEMTAATPAPTGVDTFLYLYGPNGSVVAQNDDIWLPPEGDQTDSRIPCVNTTSGPCAVEFFTLPQTGTYIIIATSFSSGDSGAYSISLTSEPLLLTAQVTDVVGTGAALNSVTFARTSNAANTAFSITDPFNFSSDQTTRLILFTSDLGLPSQQNPSPTGPNALLVTAGGQDLLVENVGPFSFPGLNGSYIVVALKQRNGQAMVPGNLVFTVTYRGLPSNAVTLTIAP